MKVFIYRNLHKEGSVYSIKSIEGITKGLVIGYAYGIIVENCKLIVSETGRKRVLKEKRKNVHAGIVGDLVAVAGYQTRAHVAKLKDKVKFYNDEQWLKEFGPGIPITYNPYLYTSFVQTGSKLPVHQSEKVMFFHQRVELLK
jgi:hypothetical protein